MAGIAADLFFSIGLTSKVPRFVVLRFYLMIINPHICCTGFPALGFSRDSCPENIVSHFVHVRVFSLDLYL